MGNHTSRIWEIEGQRLHLKVVADRERQAHTSPLLKSQPVHNYHCTGLLVCAHLGVFNSDATEVAINKIVEPSQRRLMVNSQREQGGRSPALKRHLEFQIKTLQNAPRDADKLELVLKVKQGQKEYAMHIEIHHKVWS
jgi:hypothetical protein